MDSVMNILIIVGIGIGVTVLIKILSAPLKFIMKMLFNTLLGFAILFLVNMLGSSSGLCIETNLLNCLITGVFGIPGIVALIILRFLL